MNEVAPKESGGEFLLYQAEDGQVKLEVRLEDETVWLTQQMMAELFQTTVPNINMHTKHIFEEGELHPEATIKKFLIVRREGKRNVRRELDFYNLDMIISVGYRVKSRIATRFRIWATQRLQEYIIKGFALDDERLKEAGGGNYFDELLARIRDIRSSEKVFWRKVLDIYALSIDYDPHTDYSREFFAVVQNKMHWAAHGHTAAEIIDQRANATKSNMGLTTWSGEKPRKADVEVAKNYLSEKELDVLNRIVTMYLEFAELQALNRKPMYMHDWISKLDDFLRLSDREILTHAGTVSHEQALDRALEEYQKFRREHLNDPSPVEVHFLDAVKEIKQLKKSRDPSDKEGSK
ncbi:MAG: virulence RhuM family protein [Proteobacteria bacterium]|nr:virulence RhuM family protein [Pseudomonadota bacterium]